MQALSGNETDASQQTTGDFDKALARDQTAWTLTFVLLTTLAETMFLVANISSTMAG